MERTYRGAGIVLHRDARGWFYDGPASSGPREVRTSGRGPYWCGYVSRQFAAVLLKRMRELGYLPKEKE